MPTALKKNIVFIALAFLPVLLIGCGGGSGGDGLSDYSVLGRVTYKRLPIKTDDSGHPIGLETPDNAETMPLRGVTVRAVWRATETMPDDSTVYSWRASSSATTNSDGVYAINLANDDEAPVFIEVISEFYFDFGSGDRCTVRVVADENGMGSDVPQADRPLYSIRRGLDGSPPPDNDPTPATVSKGKNTLNIEIGLDDEWWIGHANAKYAPGAELEPNGSGGRIAAILDAAFSAAASFGDPTPGRTLDIHYRRGITEPFGTYVEYDLERFAAVIDPADPHFFGSVSGGPQYDDAWDEGAILSMMARNNLRKSGIPSRFHLPARMFPCLDPRNQWLSVRLQPTMALAEGLPDAMAAIALGTPYITSASGTAVRDVRNITGLPSDVYSGPAIAAFSWELALKVNGIDAPGTPETWKNIDPTSANPLFALAYEYAIDEGMEFSTYRDLPSLFTQLSQMSSCYDVLTDEAVAQAAEPFFGAIWPRPEEGPLSRFIADWGSDPDSEKNPILGFAFSMADATVDAEGRFPNLTSSENMTAKIYMSKDTAYWMSVVPAPTLPSGASIEVRVVERRHNDDGTASESAAPPLCFGTSHQNPQRVVLRGGADGTVYQLLHFSLKSPTAIVPDTQISVSLDPAY